MSQDLKNSIITISPIILEALPSSGMLSFFKNYQNKTFQSIRQIKGALNKEQQQKKVALRTPLKKKLPEGVLTQFYKRVP